MISKNVISLLVIVLYNLHIGFLNFNDLCLSNFLTHYWSTKQMNFNNKVLGIMHSLFNIQKLLYNECKSWSAIF